MKISKSFLFALAVVALLVQQAFADDDGKKLKLFVAVTDEYMFIGARGGSLPNEYYRVLDGMYSNRYAAIGKKSEDDPGRVIWAVYSLRNGKPDSAYVDADNLFLSFPGEGPLGMQPPSNLAKPSAGTVLATVSLNSARTLSRRDAQRYARGRHLYRRSGERPNRH